MTLTPDFVAYKAKMDAAAALEVDILPQNKTALFEALAAAGIRTVIIKFDGCGDSGQIESVEAYSAENTEIALPNAFITIQTVVFDGPSITAETRSVSEAVETMAYAILESTHGGWENNDGAYGEFTFDVTDRTILLQYNERYTETHYSEHEF